MALKRSLRYGILLVVMVFGFGMALQNAGAASGLDTLRETSKAFAEVSKKVIPAVVSVQVEKSIQVSRGMDPFGTPFDDEFFERFFGRRFRQPTPEKRMQKGQGSGFIISPDGYILTNNHVVGEADKILVALNDGREMEAKVIGTDPKSDVALIKVEADNLPVIDLGDSDKLEIGEWVIAVGNPFGLSETVTVGVVSAKSRSVGIAEYEDFIQTDAAINPGNSGGPLLDSFGRVIGVNTAILSPSGSNAGIGFAVPIDTINRVVPQLIARGRTANPYLGVVVLNDSWVERLEALGIHQLEGAVIRSVVRNSPADRNGLIGIQQDEFGRIVVGDIIMAVNGKPVKNQDDLYRRLDTFSPGDEITLRVRRGGMERDVTVRLDVRPN